MPDPALSDGRRETARAELDRHWRAGNIDPADHEARVTRVRNAATSEDLDAALSGLPALPGDGDMLPLGEGVGRPTSAPGAEPRASAPANRPADAPTVSEPRRTPVAASLVWGVVGVMPFICLILAMTTGVGWWIWLLIPIAGTLGRALVGDRRDWGEHRSRRRERRRRRR